MTLLTPAQVPLTPSITLSLAFSGVPTNTKKLTMEVAKHQKAIAALIQ